MSPIFRPLKTLSWQNFYRKFKFHIPTDHLNHSKPHLTNLNFLNSLANSTETLQNPDADLAGKIQDTLKNYRNSPSRKIELALSYCNLTLTQDLVLDVLKRNSSDWKLAHVFFNWVCKNGQLSIGSCVYNEILDILGKLRRFDEMTQVLDEMSKRDGLVDDETYRVLVHRYAGAHKVEEAIGIFERSKEFGSELDLVAFQKLLLALCRYKHVEVAESLLHSRGNEFNIDIKTMNIVLNGWCALGNVHEAKRFWKDIVQSKHKPDMYTYAIFIKTLTKKGKLGTAMKMYRGLWEQGWKPDVVICNCVIDALCFKKRIPEALKVFKEMEERGCPRDVGTYNSLIKHMCKIERMEKVYELLDQMEEKKGSCMPDNITFNYLLKSLKKPDELPMVLERMERNGCKMNTDSYDLILRLYADWDDEENVRKTWDDMEKNGLGPDRRSYTIMIHWLHGKGRIDDALRYFSEMTSKGLVPEPRTKMLMNAV